MDITLPSKKNIELVKSVVVNTDKVKINQVTDNYTQVIALITIGDSEETKEVVLWEGVNYRESWNHLDVETRLKELL